MGSERTSQRASPGTSPGTSLGRLSREPTTPIHFEFAPTKGVPRHTPDLWDRLDRLEVLVREQGERLARLETRLRGRAAAKAH